MKERPPESCAICRRHFLQGEAIRVYRESLEFDRRVLLEEFHLQDFARKVVGVGSVGTRAWIGLMMGRDGNDPATSLVRS